MYTQNNYQSIVTNTFVRKSNRITVAENLDLEQIKFFVELYKTRTYCILRESLETGCASLLLNIIVLEYECERFKIVQAKSSNLMTVMMLLKMQTSFNRK